MPSTTVLTAVGGNAPSGTALMPSTTVLTAVGVVPITEPLLLTGVLLGPDMFGTLNGPDLYGTLEGITT
jgi:hypothetical protein